VQAFMVSADAAFRLDHRAVIWWREAAVAQLVKGDSLYVPRAELAASDLLSIDQTQRMQARLVNFLAAHTASHLLPAAPPLPRATKSPPCHQAETPRPLMP